MARSTPGAAGRSGGTVSGDLLKQAMKRAEDADKRWKASNERQKRIIDRMTKEREFLVKGCTCGAVEQANQMLLATEPMRWTADREAREMETTDGV